MSVPDELSFDSILQFMLDNGGKVTNHELVKHFKIYLTNPNNRAEAREIFKKHVNTIASIKNQNNEKWLILKKKYMPQNASQGLDDSRNEDADTTLTPSSEHQDQSFNESLRSPPPYRPPPQFSPRQNLSNMTSSTSEPMIAQTFASTTSLTSELIVSPSFNKIDTNMLSSEVTGPVIVNIEKKQKEKDDNNVVTNMIRKDYPDIASSIERFESTEELQRSMSSQENIHDDISLDLRRSSNSTLEEKEQVIVKERKKLFSRNGEEDVVRPRPLSIRKNSQKMDIQKRSSGMPHLDTKGHEWIVRASAGDYDTLARMCENNPKLVKTKDPITTALHWAAKKGDDRLVKLIATIAPGIVNEKTGYTPLHIAMQFRHEHIYKMLIDVFDADPNITDYSGRKPRQYPVSLESWSPIKKATKKQADMGFLRIGSLNLRVKKTTSAVSNFLGVGANRVPGSYRNSTPKYRDARDAQRPLSEQDHIKSWGSADNIPQDNKGMQPPANHRVKRRASRTTSKGRGDTQSRSTPSTPNQPRALLSHAEDSLDSDSDSAAGFHSEWQTKRNSQF